MAPDEQKKAKKPLRSFLDNYEDDPEEREMKVGDQLDFMQEKANVQTIYKIIQERLVDNYKDVLAKDIAIQYQDIIHGLKRAVRESRALKKELLETAQAGLQERRKKVEENKKACEEIRACQEQLQAYIKNVDIRTNNNLQKILAAMDRKPDPDYMVKGKKLYDGTLKSIKKFVFGK